MTREYESEVPVRNVIFVDSSARTRTGPWGSRVCDASSRLAASLANAALKSGDPAGLVLFSETEIQHTSPSWGERTLFRILEMLADSCRDDVPACNWNVELQDRALEVCHERYPELLDARVNKVPWTLFPLTPRRRQVAHTRARLASLLCRIDGLRTTDWARLMYDDEMMGGRLSRLLTLSGRRRGQARTSASAPRDDAGLNRLLGQLRQALQQAVGRARDNENYIVVCDLLDLEHLLTVIRPAIQLARSRHHQLGFVSPLPSSYAVSGNGNDPPTAALLLHEARQIEQLERRDRLTRQLRALGASVTFADKDQPISMTLARLHLIRRSRAAAGAL